MHKSLLTGLGLLVVAACGTPTAEDEIIASLEDAPEVQGDVEIDHRGGGFDLILDPTYEAGGPPGTVQVVGGVPFTTARVLRGANGTTCPAITAPDCIPLSNIVVQLTGGFDAVGTATFGLAIPGSVPAGAVLRMVGMGGNAAPFLISDQKQATIVAPGGAPDTALLFAGFFAEASVTGPDVDLTGTHTVYFDRFLTGNPLCEWTWDTNDIAGPPDLSTCDDPLGQLCTFAFNVELTNGAESGGGTPGYVGCSVFGFDPVVDATAASRGIGQIPDYGFYLGAPYYYNYYVGEQLMYYADLGYGGNWYAFLYTYGSYDAVGGTFNYGFDNPTLYFVPLP